MKHVPLSTPNARSAVALDRLAWLRGYLESMAQDYGALEGEARLQAADRMASFLADTVVTRIQTEVALAGKRPDALILAIGRIVEKLRADASKDIEQD